jgi:hypothetical protein
MTFAPLAVIPAKAGIHLFFPPAARQMDPGLRRGDGEVQ